MYRTITRLLSIIEEVSCFLSFYEERMSLFRSYLYGFPVDVSTSVKHRMLNVSLICGGKAHILCEVLSHDVKYPTTLFPSSYLVMSSLLPYSAKHPVSRQSRSQFWDVKTKSARPGCHERMNLARPGPRAGFSYRIVVGW